MWIVKHTLVVNRNKVTIYKKRSCHVDNDGSGAFMAPIILQEYTRVYRGVGKQKDYAYAAPEEWGRRKWARF